MRHINSNGVRICERVLPNIFHNHSTNFFTGINYCQEVTYRDNMHTCLPVTCVLHMQMSSSKHISHASSSRQSEERKYRIETEKMCVICRIKDFEYVIQPCGHLTCDVCSELDICVCNVHVTSKHVCILSHTLQNPRVNQDTTMPLIRSIRIRHNYAQANTYIINKT
jgi:hypothetical protein